MAELEINDILDNTYEIEKKVNRSTHSEIILVNNIHSKEKFIIKVYNITKNVKLLLKDLSNEISSLRKINHENVLKIKDFKEFGNVFRPSDISFNTQLLYIVLEPAENFDLFSYICSISGFTENVAKEIFFQLISGIRAIHEEGIAHRHITLDKIFFDKDFVLKIGDFGFSKFCVNESQLVKFKKEYSERKSYTTEFDDEIINNLNLNSKNKSESYSFIDFKSPEFSKFLKTRIGLKSTRGYESPQMLEGRGYNGFENDVFSCGVVLFYLVLGFSPFSDASQNDPRYKYIFKEKFKEYWSIIEKTSKSNPPSDSLKDLIIGMIRYKNRMSLNDVFKHKWLKDLGSKNEDEENKQNKEVLTLKEKEVNERWSDLSGGKVNGKEKEKETEKEKENFNINFSNKSSKYNNNDDCCNSINHIECCSNVYSSNSKNNKTQCCCYSDNEISNKEKKIDGLFEIQETPNLSKINSHKISNNSNSEFCVQVKSNYYSELEKRRKIIQQSLDEFFLKQNQPQYDDLSLNYFNNLEREEDETIRFYQGPYREIKDNADLFYLEIYRKIELKQFRKLRKWKGNLEYNKYSNLIINNFDDNSQEKIHIALDSLISYFLEIESAAIFIDSYWNILIKIPICSTIDCCAEEKEDTEKEKERCKSLKSSFHKNFPNFLFQEKLCLNESNTENQETEELVSCSFIIKMYFNEKFNHLVLDYTPQNYSNPMEVFEEINGYRKKILSSN